MRRVRERFAHLAAVLLAIALLPIPFICLYVVYSEVTAPLGRYRSIPAEITTSQVQRSQVSNVGKNSSAMSWSVNIDYRYVVDGVTYTSYGHYVGAPANEAGAKALGSGQFAVGRPLRVYYDPQHPAQSRLDASRNSLKIGLLTGLSAVFLYPMYLVVSDLIQRLRRP